MTADSTLPVPGDILAEKYRVERMLGAGGMGTVFEVLHRVTGKRFAVKWMLPELSANDEAVQRFIREAQVAGRFDHPNAVEVYDIGQERGSLYMVMELLRGESLSALLEREGRISAGRAARILVPCLRAVARAHKASIVHRDLKPPNIFLCRARDGAPEQPKVLDFGISKIMRSGQVDTQLTKGGMVMGTPHYMAPEQVRGQPIDARADIYAFGVILYELVSGQLPFPSENFGELVLQIATTSPKPLDQLVPGLPPGFSRLVARAMARTPDERFATAAEMGKALQQFATAADEGVPERRASSSGLARAGQTRTPSGSQEARARTPSGGQGRTPSAGQGRTPSGGQGRTPSGGQGRTPSGGQGRTPSGGQGRTPSGGASRTPSGGQARTPSAGMRGSQPSRTPSGGLAGARGSRPRAPLFDGGTLELGANTPLVSEGVPTPMPSPMLAPGQLSWLLVTLATAITALVVTLFLLWPNRDAISTSTGPAVGVTQTPEDVRPNTPAPQPHYDPPPAVIPTAPYVPPAGTPQGWPQGAQGMDPPPAAQLPTGEPPRDGADDAPDVAGERVIGPWKRQALPGRDTRRARPSDDDDAFDPLSESVDEPPSRPSKSKRSSPRPSINNPEMDLDEF